MKKIVICALALMVLLSTAGCARLFPDAVKEILVTEIRAEKKGSTSEATQEATPENTPASAEIEVEVQMDKADDVILRSDDGIDTGIYEYENGLNTKISYYNNVTKELSGYEVMVYDGNGNVIEKAVYTDEGEMEDQYLYEYDGQNRLVKEVELYGEGKLWGVFTYKYSEEGLLSETRVYDDEMLVDLVQTLLHTYDENGHLVRTDCYDDEGEFIFATHFVCDGMGNVIHEETYFSNSPEQADHVYNYTFVYNEHGQIIKENGVVYEYGPMP